MWSRSGRGVWAWIGPGREIRAPASRAVPASERARASRISALRSFLASDLTHRGTGPKRLGHLHPLRRQMNNILPWPHVTAEQTNQGIVHSESNFSLRECV